MHDAIVEKIRKLHALAESPGNEAEAALAASRVQELLAKHNLAIGEVVLKEDPGATLPVGKAWIHIPSHAATIANACDELFDVLFYYSRRGRYAGWRFVFIGLKANVEAAATTYEYLMESVNSLARGAKTLNLIHGTNEFQAFRAGAAMRIWDIARKQKRQVVASNPAYGQIVHIGNAVARQMQDALQFKGRGRGGNGDRLSWSSEAYWLGYSEGESVDLAGARTNRMLK
jgi:hypothetical protein